jgi:hypothetical protein
MRLAVRSGYNRPVRICLIFATLYRLKKYRKKDGDDYNRNTYAGGGSDWEEALDRLSPPTFE